ncbi:MAG: hypothetical protein ACYDB7_11320, partial [Mycobacteriales bacterium]
FSGTGTAVGMVLAAIGRATRAAIAVTASGGESLRLNGPLAASLTPGRWVAAGQIGPFAAYLDPGVGGPVWTTGGPAQVSVLASSPWTGSTRVTVRSQGPVSLVRSAADIPGWQITVRTAGHPVSEPLERLGLVQRVPLPAGNSVVTFTYHPPGLALGWLLAAAGTVLLAALAGCDRRAAKTARADQAGAGQGQRVPGAGRASVSK